MAKTKTINTVESTAPHVDVAALRAKADAAIDAWRVARDAAAEKSRDLDRARCKESDRKPGTVPIPEVVLARIAAERAVLEGEVEIWRLQHEASAASSAADLAEGTSGLDLDQARAMCRPLFDELDRRVRALEEYKQELSRVCMPVWGLLQRTARLARARVEAGRRTPAERMPPAHDNPAPHADLTANWSLDALAAFARSSAPAKPFVPDHSVRLRELAKEEAQAHEVAKRYGAAKAEEAREAAEAARKAEREAAERKQKIKDDLVALRVRYAERAAEEIEATGVALVQDALEQAAR